MKKTIAILMAMILICLVLPVICEEELTGDWYLTEIGGVNPEYYGQKMTLSLQTDGKAIVKAWDTVSDETVELEGTWYSSGKKVYINIDGDKEEFTIVNETLQTDSGNGMISIFSRTPPLAIPVIEYAETEYNVQESSFEGKWKAEYVYICSIKVSMPVEVAIKAGLYESVPIMSVHKSNFMIKNREFSTIFGESGIDMVFSGGTFKASIYVDNNVVEIEASLLKDGMLCLNYGSELKLYFQKTNNDSVLPTGPYADNTGNYIINTDGTATFMSQAGSAVSVSVPDAITVNGESVPVIAIKDNAFKGDKKLTTVKIGKNVQTIDKNAFANCVKLKTVKGGAGVTTIKDGAFSGCKALKTFPTMNKLQSIGATAFKNCAKLTKFILGTAVKSIGKNAFNGCKALKTITIKTEKLTNKNVGTGAFKGINKKATFKCPKKQLKNYKTLFVKKGAPKSCKFK